MDQKRETNTVDAHAFPSISVVTTGFAGDVLLEKINRDAQLRGRSAPVFPVRLRRWRTRPLLRGVFVAAQKLVSFDLGYHSDAAGLVGLVTLDASEAANLHRSGKRDFMRERQQDLHR